MPDPPLSDEVEFDVALLHAAAATTSSDASTMAPTVRFENERMRSPDLLSDPMLVTRVLVPQLML